MYIYLVFSQTGTWLARLLRVCTRTKYVHVSLGLDDELVTMYSFGRINPNNPISGGYVKENLHDGVYKKNKHSECVVYRVEVNEKQYENLLNNINHFDNLDIDFRYNFLGLFAAALNISVKRKKHYFCSEFISELLIKSDIFESEKPAELIKPNDLLDNIENKEKLFEGYVREYIESYSVKEECLVE